MSLKMKKVFVAWCLSVLLVFAVAGGGAGLQQRVGAR
jgi:hypothetical protein